MEPSRGRALGWVGLAFLALLTLPALTATGSKPEPGGVRTVEMTIHHSRFRQDGFSFEPGTTVRFVIENTDPIDHEFILGDAAVQRIHENGTEAHHGARPGEISIPAGETRTTTYTFGESGSLLFGCHLPGHYAYGMRGVVLVA